MRIPIILLAVLIMSETAFSLQKSSDTGFSPHEAPPITGGSLRQSQSYSLMDRDRTRKYLDEYHWTPEGRDWFLNNVDVRVDPSLGPGTASYYGVGRPETKDTKPYVLISDKPGKRGHGFSLSHEGQHAWEDHGDGVPGFNEEEKKAAFRALLNNPNLHPTVKEIVQRTLDNHSNEAGIDWHWNHYLIDGLGGDTTLVPDDYYNRWYRFTQRSPGWRWGRNGERLPGFANPNEAIPVNQGDGLFPATNKPLFTVAQGQHSPGARWQMGVNDALKDGHITDDEALAVYRDRVGIPEWASKQIHAMARRVYQETGKPMHEGQFNDALGQVMHGQGIDPSKWRDPARMNTAFGLTGN